MKNIRRLTLILAGVLMLTSCEDDSIAKLNESVVKSAAFLTTDYYVLNNINSLGAIYMTNPQQWKVGDKVRLTGSVKFKRPDEPAYAINEYVTNCDIKYVTDKAIYVGYDYSGINHPGSNTATIHIEFNEGAVESLQSLPRNGG
jgi:hypothetical protein